MFGNAIQRFIDFAAEEGDVAVVGFPISSGVFGVCQRGSQQEGGEEELFRVVFFFLYFLCSGRCLQFILDVNATWFLYDFRMPSCKNMPFSPSPQPLSQRERGLFVEL